ncbi:unnamed protein product [Lepidochelys olivacea]
MALSGKHSRGDRKWPLPRAGPMGPGAKGLSRVESQTQGRTRSTSSRSSWDPGGCHFRVGNTRPGQVRPVSARPSTIGSAGAWAGAIALRRAHCPPARQG